MWQSPIPPTQRSLKAARHPNRRWLSHFSARVGRTLVSDKAFNIPIVAIHCSNAQNVGFENPTCTIILSI
ncbi:hypothetical protein [Neisseria sp.]